MKKCVQTLEVWKIVACISETVQVAKLDLGRHTEELTIAVQALLDEGRQHKGSVTQRLPMWTPQTCPNTLSAASS